MRVNKPAKYRCRSISRLQYGQTAIIALLVLMLLAFAGALFVTIVARNLFNAAHQTRLETADYYAEAGIRYADDQLTNSWEGADWRPAKTPVFNNDDPDKDDISNGFSRYNTTNGRFLIRLTYNPNPDIKDPLNKYIKIESIGREGVVDPKDPTTYHVKSAKRVLVAYKQIGITDYGRFITNIDKRSDIANLGVASIYDTNQNSIVTPGVNDFYVNSGKFVLRPYPVITTYGAIDAYTSQDNGATIKPNPMAGTSNGTASLLTTYYPGGGSIRSNSTIRFFGLNQVYLNNQGINSLLGKSGTNTPYQLFEEIDTSGRILLDQFDSNKLAETPSALQVYIPSSPAGWQTASPSPYNFTTINGMLRDGERENDSSGLPRSINRLDPPTIDTNNSLTGLNRYVDMAIHSEPRFKDNNPATTYASGSAQYGYGKIVYVDNTSDIQKDSSKPGVGATLVDEWLNGSKSALSGTGSSQSYWVGDIYNPPGADVAIGDLRYYTNVGIGNHSSYYGIDIFRNDKPWQNADGTAGSSSDMPIFYDDLGASDNDPNNNPNNDIILVFTGNVKVHGVISNPASINTSDGLERHITIVTFGTAYIDGNILRGNPKSSIAILAKDYVCVNTTQFTAGRYVQKESGFHNTTDTITLSTGITLSQELSFGYMNNNATQKPANYTSSAAPNANLALYMEGAAGTGNSGDATTSAQVGLLQPFLSLSSTAPTYNPYNIPNGSPSDTFTFGLSNPARNTVDLSSQNYLDSDNKVQLLSSLPYGSILHLQVQKGITAQQDLILKRIAILPMDIRIEALLYAQNKSFFVLPGNSFNTNPNDTVDKYITNPLTSGSHFNRIPLDNDDDNQQRYPFYNQPIDLKITIYGSVSEAHPADIGAQTAWMLKWGWIPQYHGSKVGASSSYSSDTAITQEVSGHVAPGNPPAPTAPSIGLSIIYNPQLAYPIDPSNGSVGLRKNGTNVLPIVPRLPVCPGLLYSGEIPQLPS